MDYEVGQIVKLKKKHPCGSQEWLVLRVGMDFKMRCQGCGHEVMLPRSKAEKNIKKVFRDGQPVENGARAVELKEKISIRGTGKFIYDQQPGISKKGKLRVRFLKYS